MCAWVLSANVGLHQSSGFLNAVFVTWDAVLPALWEPGAPYDCISCLWNICGSDGLLAAGSWLAFRGEGERVRTINNYERWHFEIICVLWLSGSKVLVSTKQVHNSLGGSRLCRMYELDFTYLRFCGKILSQWYEMKSSLAALVLHWVGHFYSLCDIRVSALQSGSDFSV